MQEATFRNVVVCLLSLFHVTCASHGEVHVAPDESKPHISWELRSGTNEGDEEFICGSSQADKPCVLMASTEDRPRLAALHLLGHAAARPTSYLGFMRTSLFENEAERKLAEINVTIEPGSRPVGTTVLGRVTSKPGMYSLTISVDATQPGAAAVRISQQVPIVLK